eukprot:714734-Amphidinium_carterae.1
MVTVFLRWNWTTAQQVFWRNQASKLPYSTPSTTYFWDISKCWATGHAQEGFLWNLYLSSKVAHTHNFAQVRKELTANAWNN